MGTYFFAIVELDDGPRQMNPPSSEELTLAGHIDATDPRVRGVIAHISTTPRRVSWMSDYSIEYQALYTEWITTPHWRRELHDCSIPAEAPCTALDFPIVADLDQHEYFDAREWGDHNYPLPVLAAQYLTGSMASDEDWAQLVGNWYGHQLRAYPASELAEVAGYRKISAP